MVLIIIVLLAELAKVRQYTMNRLNAKYRFDQKKRNIIKYKNLLAHIKIGKEKLYRHKSPIF